MDDLDYEKHLENYKRLYGYYCDNPYIDKNRTLKDAEEEANYSHALCVFGPLRDWMQKAIQIAGGLTSTNARYYLLHGAGRRFDVTFRAYQKIISIAYDKRSAPLSQDEQIALSQAINITYMNIPGILDNFAWCLIYERQPELADKIPKNNVGLFSEKFRKQFDAFTEVEKEIKVHDLWQQEVKERRDPVAHRIPLYVPPSLVTQEEAKAYSAVYNRFSDSLNNLKLDEADVALKQMDSIGTFLPCFVHHPEEPPIPIYPTIPADVSHLIRIADAVANCLLGKARQST
jgi:hypothetical protein